MINKQAYSVVEVFWVFLKLGLTSFGGPVAHIGYFHRELVVKRKWLSESHFAQLLSICQVLPGPASSQLGFALGLLRGGHVGAVLAFIAFTFPSVMALFLFSMLLPYLDASVQSWLVQSLKLIAVIIVSDAVISMSRKLCFTFFRAALAVITASVMILTPYLFLQFMCLVVAASLGGYFLVEPKTAPVKVLPIKYGKPKAFIFLISFFILLFLLPVLGRYAHFFELATIFYRSGALVFGGGHVVLPLLEQSLVQTHLLNTETFLAGYGATQLVPGPLFSFAAYAGFELSGPISGIYGASIALMAIFLPGFLLLLAVLPFWKQLSRFSWFTGAVAGVNAAVVGLLGAALYNPVFTTSVVHWQDLVVAIVGLGIVTLWRKSLIWTVIWCLLATFLLSYIDVGFK